MTIKVKFVGDTSDLENASGRASKALGDVAKIAGGFIVAQGLMKLPGLLMGTVSAASDLEESMSKINTVLGPAAKGMDAWAEGMSKFGQSKGEALAAAGAFANFFVTVGQSQADAAKMSKSLTELASDFASFHNADPSEVITAMGAALRGEAEPMSRYGILMNDATLRAEALKLGLIASVKEGLTPQEKALAANSLMFAQAGSAIGDFERTSDGLANKQRVLSAEFANTRAELGEKLLPAALKLTDALTKALPPLANFTAGFVDFLTTSKGAVEFWRDASASMNHFSDTMKDVFGDPGRIDAARDATNRYAAAVAAAGKDGDALGVVTKMLSADMAKFSEDGIGTTDSLSKLFAGVDVGVPKVKQYEEGVKAAGKAMADAGASTTQLYQESQKLPPSLQSAFAAGSGLKGKLDELAMGAWDAGEAFINGAAPGLDALTAAASPAGAQMGTFAGIVAGAAGELDKLDKAMATINNSFTTMNPAVISAQASLALIDEAIGDVKGSSKELTEAQTALVASLEASKAPYEAIIASSTQTSTAMKGLEADMKRLMGPEGWAGFASEMLDAGQSEERIIDLTAQTREAFGLLASGDLPAARSAFQNLKAELSPDEWAEIAKAIGVRFPEAAKSGMIEGVEVVRAGGEELGDAAVEGLESRKDDMHTAGEGLGANAGLGLAAGLDGAIAMVRNAAIRLSNAAVVAAKSPAGLYEGSPSKKFVAMGLHAGEGLVIGMQQSEPMVAKAAQRMVGAGISAGDGARQAWNGSGVMPEFWYGTGDLVGQQGSRATSGTNPNGRVAWDGTGTEPENWYGVGELIGQTGYRSTSGYNPNGSTAPRDPIRTGGTGLPPPPGKLPLQKVGQDVYWDPNTSTFVNGTTNMPGTSATWNPATGELGTDAVMRNDGLSVYKNSDGTWRDVVSDTHMTNADGTWRGTSRNQQDAVAYQSNNDYYSNRGDGATGAPGWTRADMEAGRAQWLASDPFKSWRYDASNEGDSKPWADFWRSIGMTPRSMTNDPFRASSEAWKTEAADWAGTGFDGPMSSDSYYGAVPLSFLNSEAGARYMAMRGLDNDRDAAGNLYRDTYNPAWRPDGGTRVRDGESGPYSTVYRRTAGGGVQSSSGDVFGEMSWGDGNPGFSPAEGATSPGASVVINVNMPPGGDKEQAKRIARYVKDEIAQIDRRAMR